MPKKVLDDWPDLVGIKVWLSMSGKFLGLTGIPPQGGYYAYNFQFQEDEYDLEEKEADKFASKEK